MDKITMRPLMADDIFQVLALIEKLDLVDTLKDLFKGELRDKIISNYKNDGKNKNDKKEKSEQLINESVGFDIMVELGGLAVRRIPMAKQEINDLLASLTGKTPEEIGQLPIAIYIGLVKDFFTHNDFKELSTVLGL